MLSLSYLANKSTRSLSIGRLLSLICVIIVKNSKDDLTSTTLQKNAYRALHAQISLSDLAARKKSGQIVVKKLHQISHNQILARPRRANELIAEQQKALDKGFGR